MTKIDERSSVPPVDAAARKRLAEALDVPGVVAAYLIGSQARGDAGPLSDVDLAVWVDVDAPADHGLLSYEAARAVLSDEVDLVVLDDASPLLRHRAVRDGVLLVDRDHDERIRRETRTILEYLDTQPLRDMFTAGLRERITEDRFGRS